MTLNTWALASCLLTTTPMPLSGWQRLASSPPRLVFCRKKLWASQNMANRSKPSMKN